MGKMIKRNTNEIKTVKSEIDEVDGIAIEKAEREYDLEKLLQIEIWYSSKSRERN